MLNKDVRLKPGAFIFKGALIAKYMGRLVPRRGEKRRILYIQQVFIMYLVIYHTMWKMLKKKLNKSFNDINSIYS